MSRTPLKAPRGEKSILLHSCCAPCACEITEALLESDIKPKIFFYNPNIHPKKEYELRKKENIRFAQEKNLEFVDADYDTENWFARVKGLEREPERGKRCTVCFDMRFVRTALYAHENGFQLMSSTLGISRWKDWDQIAQSGLRAVEPYKGLMYWTFNWRKKGGSDRMVEISKKEGFYQQEYCGCVYSLRDTNEKRKKRGLSRIHIGTKYYSNEPNDLKDPNSPNGSNNPNESNSPNGSNSQTA